VFSHRSVASESSRDATWGPVRSPRRRRLDSAPADDGSAHRMTVPRRRAERPLKVVDIAGRSHPGVGRQKLPGDDQRVPVPVRTKPVVQRDCVPELGGERRNVVSRALQAGTTRPCYLYIRHATVRPLAFFQIYFADVAAFVLVVDGQPRASHLPRSAAGSGALQ
jgi:hypothetical protein